MNLDEFLKKNEGKAVSRGECATCQRADREKLDRVVTSFVARKAQGLTSVPFSVFVEKHLRPEYGYPHEYRAMERHARRCLGLEIT